jgi:hypothetical protein
MDERSADEKAEMKATKKAANSARILAATMVVKMAYEKEMELVGLSDALSELTMVSKMAARRVGS